MKKKIKNLTLGEVLNICKNHTAFSCKGCVLENNYRCLGEVDLQDIDKLAFENFEIRLEQEIEVDEE